MKSTRFLILSNLAGAAAFFAGAAQAIEINTLQLLSQPEFRLLAKDLGAVGSYKPLAPAGPLGITGFDLGVSVSAVTLESREVWRKAAAGGEVPSALPVLALRGAKGLPFGLDVGLSYSAIPTTGVSLLGGELKWAFIQGGVATPAVALRVSGAKLSGLSQLDFSSGGVDLSISKGFALITPYAGIGRVRSTSTPNGVATLRAEKISQSRVFAGANFNLGIADLLVEGDRTGGVGTASLKLGYRF